MGARRPFPLSLLAVAAPVLLSACGGLTTPDLSVGEISGRLQNVVDPAQAHVYVVGHPEVRASIAADGSYRLSQVPVGEEVRVALYDGGARAGVVKVKVEAAKRTEQRDDAEKLPRASRVVVVARTTGGAKASGARYVVEGTIVEGEGGPDSRAELFPVPPGEWIVRGTVKGYKAEEVAVSLGDDATAPLELECDEPDDSAGAGCLSSSCGDGLRCDSRDGRCYACVADADCGAGLRCENHACVADSTRDACDPCSDHAQCGPGGLCLPAGSGTAGFCATAVGSGCDAGFEARSVNGFAVCTPPLWPSRPADACYQLFSTFGATCLSASSCQHAIFGGVCAKPPGAGSTTAGVCTAACVRDSDCPKLVGWGRCDPATLRCAR